MKELHERVVERETEARWSIPFLAMQRDVGGPVLNINRS